jgi:nicotinamide riboside kinase
VPEYSREYLQDFNGLYSEADILNIAKGQLMLEEEKLKKTGRLLFSDTELLVCKIWSEEKFGRCDPWILHQLDQQNYKLYMLCKPDLPWKPDPLRESPRDRDRLFGLYLHELTVRKLPFFIVSGQGSKRIKTAIQAIDDLYIEI